MTVFYWDEYAAEEILQAYHEDMEAQADMFLLDTDPDGYGNEWTPPTMFEFDAAEEWLAAQDVPDWTA